MSFKSRLYYYQQIEKRPIVYIDESDFCVDDPRIRGYSPRGKPCYAKKDWHSKGRMNAIGAIIDFKLINVCLFNGTINAEVFYEWFTKELLLKIPSSSVIVLDNATFHKRNDMLEAAQKQNHTLEFLPPYSPDLNPIEKKWAQAKNIRRRICCDPYQLFLHPHL